MANFTRDFSSKNTSAERSSKGGLDLNQSFPIQFSPKLNTVNRLIAFSKALECHRSSGGSAEIILN